MKKKLQERLLKLESRKKELGTKGETTTDIAELRSINKELAELNDDIAELRGMIDAMPDDANGGTDDGTQRSMPPIGKTQIIGSYGNGLQSNNQIQNQRSSDVEDPYATLEYRNAFMKFARTGEVTAELRADAMTGTSDISAVIPTTILNEVVKKLSTYGQIFSRVRKLNVKGGVAIPILSLKPEATWIGESTPSEKKKVQSNSSVIFSYYGLECKVSISLLANTVSLSGFENTITELIYEAMIQAIDLAVIKGNGTGKMLGITADNRVPAGQIVTLSAADFTTLEGWKKKIFAKMPLSYKAGASFIMASGTWEGYIDGMVDANGQPIARTNYGISDGIQERFAGKEVIQVEDDIITPYDDASVGDVVAIYCNLKNYGVNSNMQMMMYRYFDHDTNEWVDKAILIADGKLMDPNGVVIIKKGA